MTKAKEEPCPDGCLPNNYTDYYVWGGCSTPYCGGWRELHCRLCGWYLSHCACSCSTDYNKTSAAARKAVEKKKNKGVV